MGIQCSPQDKDWTFCLLKAKYSVLRPQVDKLDLLSVEDIKIVFYAPTSEKKGIQKA